MQRRVWPRPRPRAVGWPPQDGSSKAGDVEVGCGMSCLGLHLLGVFIVQRPLGAPLHPLPRAKSVPPLWRHLLVSLSTRWLPRASSYFFMGRMRPFISHHLLVSSALGILSGHLHPPSRAKKVAQSCIASWCHQHRVASQIILLQKKKSHHLASSLGVFSTGCPPRASPHSSCTNHLPPSCSPGVLGVGCYSGVSLSSCRYRPPPSILHHLLVFLSIACPPGASSCFMMSISRHPLLMFSAPGALLGPLHPPSPTGHLHLSCTSSWCL